MTAKVLGAYAPDGSLYITLTDGAGNLATLPTAGQLVGTATNDNATAGNVGEYVTATATAGSVSVTANVSINITSISLTAGDWDVIGIINYLPATTTTIQTCYSSISNTTGTLGAAAFMAQQSFVPGTVLGNNPYGLITMPTRITLTTTTTIFLVGNTNFGVSTMTAGGTIRARRVR